MTWRNVTELNGTAWCELHDDVWIEGEPGCQRWFFDDGPEFDIGDCVEVPLYLSSPPRFPRVSRIARSMSETVSATARRLTKYSGSFRFSSRKFNQSNATAGRASDIAERLNRTRQ